MKKIIVIGCPGSGKSTFSRSLHQITNIPLIHLDMLFWNPDRTTVQKELFHARLENAMAQSSWIIDGNYSSTMELRMQACDTVIFLDYPLEICLAGIKARQGKARSDMPWIETGEDPEFLSFIQNFRLQFRPQIETLLQKYAHKDIFVFSDRRQEADFLAALQK